ncbi:MAG: hypothetical protein HY821_07090 [Acidobacteria bacterium]|nr:hypothetical protein [Acidobacteriota bacterium]
MFYRVRPIALALLLSLLFADARPASATETDQFTTPPAPRNHLGPHLSRKIVRIIEESNRPNDDPERILMDWVGHNVFASRLVRWIKEIRAAAGPVTFLPHIHNSIYRIALSPAPASFLFDSPTIHVHGAFLGTDKIDHFFQQGFEYYEIVLKQESLGATPDQALAAAVARGVKQEHNYYGTLASGIYSNADLAANYAGLKFYLNLRRPVRIANRELPPLFQRTPQGWRLRAGIDPARILEPFFSNHLDESLNPSRYRFSRRTIRPLIRERCARWTRFYSDRLDLVAPAAQSFAATWFGEPYGHWLPLNQEISIATECAAYLPRGPITMKPAAPAAEGDSHE